MGGGPVHEKVLQFDLEGRDHIELQDLLKVMGFFESGGMAKAAILEGLVTVDGASELRRRRKVRAGQVVEYNSCSIMVR
jgi:ribosome-associated protein